MSVGIDSLESSKQGVLNTAEVTNAIVEAMHAANIDQAAEFYSRCQEDIGFQLIGACSTYDEKVRENLARMFFVARDYQKSALVCEELGEWEKAAKLYYRADDYYLAAEMFSKIEQFDRAAEMFEKNGNFNEAASLFAKCKMYDRAAVNFERAVNNILAGRLYFELGKHQKAMDVLQKVKTGEDGFYEATKLIGKILMQTGYVDLAGRKFVAVCRQYGINDDTIEVFYMLAEIFMQKKEWDKALQVFAQILDFDFDYSDVREKVELVKSYQSGAAQAPPSPAAANIEAPGEQQQAPVGGQAGATSGQAYVSVMDGFEYLKGLSLFSELSLQEIKAFYNICEDVTFNPREVIIKQGVPGEALYIVREGTISIQHITEKGEPNHIVDLSVGAHVGEMALIDDAPTSAQVMSKDNVRCFRISREKFERLLEGADKIAIKLYKVFVSTLATRLRKATSDLAELKAEMN